MIEALPFIIALVVLAMVYITILIVDIRDERASRDARQRTVSTIYVACRRERARTRIIDHDKHLIVGDGAWISKRAEYPKTARIRDLPEPMGM